MMRREEWIKTVTKVAMDYKKDLEQIKTIDEFFKKFEPLAVKLHVWLGRKLTVTEVIVQLGYGGPTVELELGRGILVVRWGDVVSVEINNRDLLDALWDYYVSYFEELCGVH